VFSTCLRHQYFLINQTERNKKKKDMKMINVCFISFLLG